jgi:hypothetical protein
MPSIWILSGITLIIRLVRLRMSLSFKYFNKEQGKQGPSLAGSVTNTGLTRDDS